jgi:hypothetical protein
LDRQVRVRFSSGSLFSTVIHDRQENPGIYREFFAGAFVKEGFIR